MDAPKPTAEPAYVPTGIRRKLLGNEVADALRRDILLGRLRPGVRLAQQRLCEQFGTSRMPVRDALRQLITEGLLLVDEGQHTVVAPLSRDDFVDAFQIEGILHGLAARRAASKMTPADWANLGTLHERMLRAAAEGDVVTMASTNWEFHRSINRLSGSRKLLAALRTVSLDIPRDFLLQLPDWVSKSNDDHAQVLTAMSERRLDDVELLMREHVIASGRGLMDHLEAEGLTLG
jgi:DNA-binding GntR family transcriptional regulator